MLTIKIHMLTCKTNYVKSLRHSRTSKALRYQQNHSQTINIYQVNKIIKILPKEIKFTVH